MRVESVSKFDRHDIKIDVSWFSIWGWKRKYGAFVGSCTVWHWYPSGGRPDVGTEMWLCSVWQRFEWQQQQAEQEKAK